MDPENLGGPDGGPVLISRNIEGGRGPPGPPSTYTPATEAGHLDIVKYIAEHLDDKNPVNIDGDTPLHLILLTIRHRKSRHIDYLPP